MAIMLDELAFSFAESRGSNDHEVRPHAGGVDILGVAKDGPYLGLDPPEFFRQSPLSSGGELIIGRCSCGVVGCGDCVVTVEFPGEKVAWILSSAKRFEFGHTQYLGAIADAAADTSWESLERTAERLVEALDFSSRERDGYRFQWASARIKRGRMTLSFTKDDHQRLFDVGWDHASPDDARRRVQCWLEDGV